MVRVFQGPVEIAGQMGLLAKGLAEQGYRVLAYNTLRNYLGYHRNIRNTTESELQALFEQKKRTYDIFHFHYGASFMPGHREFEFARRKNKVRLMHYWGNEVRTERLALRHNPYARLIEQFQSEQTVEKRLRLHRRYLPACIVQDFEMVPYVARAFERVYVVPLAIDLEQVDAVVLGDLPAWESEEPLIVHAPTQPGFKGTAYVEAALERLRMQGVRFRYQRVQGQAHDEAMALYARADLVIDQVLCGTYGLFAVEAMALGKSVVAYIREDLRHRFPADLPVVSANPATLETQVRDLLQNPDLRREKGLAGRRYVERYHALPCIARHVDWIYRREAQILQGDLPVEDADGVVIQCSGHKVRAYSIDPRTGLVSRHGRRVKESDDPRN